MSKNLVDFQSFIHSCIFIDRKICNAFEISFSAPLEAQLREDGKLQQLTDIHEIFSPTVHHLLEVQLYELLERVEQAGERIELEA